MEKEASVHTNDPLQPQQRLTISGQVDLFARINPRLLVLRGRAGQTLRTTARIQLQDKYPFRILRAAADSSDLKVSFRTEHQQGSLVYLVEVEALKPLPGAEEAEVRLHTDSSVKPEITLRVVVQATAG